MREIINLAGYEYKKILGRKSTWIAFGILILLVLLCGFGNLMGNFYVEGQKVDTHYNMNQKECNALRQIKGQKLDDAFFERARDVSAEVMNGAKDLQELLVSKDGWNNYCRYYMPYGHVAELCMLMEKEMDKMDGESFYKGREELQQVNYEDMEISKEETEFHRQENARIKTPFAYGNMRGFERFFSLQYSLGIILVFIVAVCLAPLFAGEYTSKMDQMILSTRYGKNKIILAKLLTGISFALTLPLAVLGLTLLEINLIYGLEGWNLPIQTAYQGFALSIPINMLQMLGISLLCALFASCMVAALVMFFSVKMKTPFGVIIVAFLVIFVPMVLLNMVPEDSIWYLFVKGTPTVMMESWVGVSERMIPFGRHCFYYFQAMPVVYACLTAGLFAWSYRSFRCHQAI